MSDTRRAIAERHVPLTLAAMSEYAAAVLEEMAAAITDSAVITDGRVQSATAWLRARAAQERER